MLSLSKPVGEDEVMLKIRYIPLVLKKVLRQRVRSALTLGGIAAAVFLFCTVQAMLRGVREATETGATDNCLVVYRENRYCPFTSRLPEYYGPRISKIAGVKSVVPMKIVVNNCRTSLDVVTFRGVPRDDFSSLVAPRLRIISGSLPDWLRRSDAALIGETLAKRRGLSPGDRFDAAGVTVYVAGVVESAEAQDQNVGYVHLDFLQRTVDNNKLGVVTQFNVTVDDPAKMGAIAAEIDATFAHDPEPTRTSPEKAFVARAASDIVEIVGFARWLGWGCLAAVLALVGNAIVLSMQDRVREHAVLQTLGFKGGLILQLVIAEGVLLGLLGGLVGGGAAAVVLLTSGMAISTEGLSIQIIGGMDTMALGVALAGTLGAAASLIPAWQASRQEIAACFRAV